MVKVDPLERVAVKELKIRHYTKKTLLFALHTHT